MLTVRSRWLWRRVLKLGAGESRYTNVSGLLAVKNISITNLAT
jgi:hypothetical protein